MKEIVKELRKLVSFKDSTSTGDLVLLASQDPQMVVYAMVTDIKPDRSRKQAWWHVTMQVLSVPPGEVVWTLREPQFTGQEIFTFDGIEHFMQAVDFAASPSSSPQHDRVGNDQSPTVTKGLRLVK